ncbi:MAG: 2-oxoglutarate dehydrogenase complex dihydrolipoyllysine-residue succinyltransferase [Arenicellales bacterium]|nr:2-oxoglutarate dehydrogenase complex dihydrolipoyllysine-residue succinyltransferase [Arenicellales bacterium]
MAVEVKVPVLPESVTEATLLNWHKQEGDMVKRDENLVDLETEKVVLEVPAPEDGVVKQLLKQDGDIVSANELLAVIEPQAVSEAAEQPAVQATEEPVRAAAPEAQVASAGMGPAARKLAAEHALDPTKIEGSGKDGRVSKADVVSFLKEQEVKSETAPASVTPAPVAPAAVSTGDRNERREPMSRLRATIARRLKDSQNTAAMLTSFNDVNLQAVMEIRKKYKEAFEEKHGVRLGFMSFFVKASIEGLKRFPTVNAYVDGDDIVYHDYYDVGIAVASPRGLVVPIIRDAEAKSFAQIETEISDLGKKARDGKLAMEDLMGGTFTITNGGVFGSMLSTPILNPPQSGILGMHRIEQRPVAEDGQVVIRPMMYLALTYDHRIIDGAEAVRFLVTVKESLEDPARLLLQV